MMATNKTAAMFVNGGQEDQMAIIGYKTHRLKRIITWVFIVLTLGLLGLVFYWRPDWMIKCMGVRAPLHIADHVMLTDQYHQIFVEEVISSSNSGSSGRSPDAQEMTQFIKDSPEGDGPHVILPAQKLPEENSQPQRYFTNKKIKYLWNFDEKNFEKLRGIEDGQSCSYFHTSSGLSQSAKAAGVALYGLNFIDVDVESILKLLFTQSLHPFYIFQLFSCALWFSDSYYYYAATILIISAISLTAQIYETRSMQRALKNTLAPIETISVLQQETGEFVTVLTDKLVPGDIIEVPRQGCIMQCDAVLVNGNCIVNESMLTGESVPVTKTPIPFGATSPGGRGGGGGKDVMFNLKEHSRHVLFCGTHVIQTRYYGSQKVKAVVVRTGFATAKGELVRSILFPKPVDFKFHQDGIKFIGCLALIALSGMIYTIVLMVQRGDDVSSIIIRTLDLVTIVIPPALPAAMTVGIVFAQKRLRDARVFCISPRSINLCGAINVFCFDKTGTLTEDGLDMYGVVPVNQNTFEEELKDITRLDRHSRMLIAMATCHSLTIIDGKITGDPLDLKMFEATDWELEEPGEDNSKYDVIMPTVVHPKNPDVVQASSGYYNLESIPYEVGILRQFTFSSKLQRMSVIARELTSDHFDLYAKGSPEMIAALCVPDSIPENFHSLLTYYTQQGYRVIGLAHKPLSKLSYVKIQRARREQVECSMTFLGLLIMENRLKAETTPIISVLKSAQIRTVMVTGDNVMTALSVARDCDMIGSNERVVMVTALPPDGDNPARIEWTETEDTKISDRRDMNVIEIDSSNIIHFSITGKSWAVLRKHFPEILPKLVVWGTVFSRFSPEQKQQLIEMLQDVGYYVGMCGDGANDCGALKTAHAGISLSEAEASVASPFTSKEQNISCVPNVIKEGRAALVTSYGVFRFMACYSLTQFLSVCILYWFGANMTDFTFLYVDLILLTTLGITFCYNGAYAYLDHVPPQVSLIAIAPIISLLFQLLVNLFFQVFIWLYTIEQPWFEPYIDNDNHDYQCYEVTVVFMSSSFQYVIMAVVFSKGAPYRTSIFSNYLFMFNMVICVLLNAFIVMYPFQWVIDLLELQVPPSVPYRALIVGLACVNFFICYILETHVLDYLIEDKCLQRLREKYIASQLRYRLLQTEMKLLRPDWPPVSQSSTTLADLLRLENLVQDTTPDGGDSDAARLNVSFDEDDDEEDELTKDQGQGELNEAFTMIDPMSDAGPLPQKVANGVVVIKSTETRANNSAGGGIKNNLPTVETTVGDYTPSHDQRARGTSYL